MSSLAGGLAVNFASRLLLLAVKLWAFWQTGFLVLLGEALNSLVDLLVTGSLLVGERVGRKGGDLEHPFGHRRARHVISLIVAVTFITVTSLQLLREAIPRLFAPLPLGDPQVAFYVLGFSFLVNLIPMGVILRIPGKRDILLKTVLFDTLNDQAAILAAGIGVWLVWQGTPLADPIAAIVVALIIGANAIVLIRENGRMLLGRSPEPRFYEAVKEAVFEVPGVRGVHDMIAEYIGPDIIHMDMDIEVDPEMTVREADHIERQVIARLRALGVVSCEVHPCAHRGAARKIHREI